MSLRPISDTTENTVGTGINTLSFYFCQSIYRRIQVLRIVAPFSFQSTYIKVSYFYISSFHNQTSLLEPCMTVFHIPDYFKSNECRPEVSPQKRNIWETFDLKQRFEHSPKLKQLAYRCIRQRHGLYRGKSEQKFGYGAKWISGDASAVPFVWPTNYLSVLFSVKTGSCDVV